MRTKLPRPRYEPITPSSFRPFLFIPLITDQFLQLATLSGDAFSFYTSYTQIDPFDFQSALVFAINSQPASARATLVAKEASLIGVYLDAETSLLNNPTSYLSRLHASASPYPAGFSSSLMSQATGILLGYESLVSQDVLSKNPSSGPITPGMSIAGGPAATSASATDSGIGATQASQGMSTSSSKAAGVPMVTSSPLLMINAAAAAVGVLGVALM